MTLKELSQLYWLNREIEKDKERLVRLRQRAYAPSGAKLTGVPGGSGFDNRLERFVIQIVELEGIIEEKIERCIWERNHLERYIATIPDSLTRQIFALRFINGLSWRQVAFSIGGGNTEEGVKKACYRYLKQENSN